MQSAIPTRTENLLFWVIFETFFSGTLDRLNERRRGYINTWSICNFLKPLIEAKESYDAIETAWSTHCAQSNTLKEILPRDFSLTSMLQKVSITAPASAA